MARIRTVKPEFWTDEKIVECSIPARLLFVGLFNFADDKGCLERSPKRIKMQVFPADTIDCEPLIMELITHGLLTEYSVNGSHYLQIPGFLKHQKINRPSNSNIPLPPSLTESSPHDGGNSLNAKGNNNSDSQNIHEALSEDSMNAHGELTDGREGKGKEGKGIKPERENNAGEAFLPPDENPPADEYQHGGATAFPPIGKFPITSDWMPQPEFARRATLWGKNLGTEPGYTVEELQQFRDYWSCDGRVKHQQQWEMAFADSLLQSRSRIQRSKPAGARDPNRISEPGKTIPDGFRGQP